MTDAQSIRIAGTEYVIVSKAEYLDLRRAAGVPAGSVDAVDHAQTSIGRGLHAARTKAKLTQGELAKRLDVSQAMVSGAERGRVRIAERYVASVLKACGLPKDWKPPTAKRVKNR
jgi:DNA-binding XRE family transcriptional regulator